MDRINIIWIFVLFALFGANVFVCINKYLNNSFEPMNIINAVAAGCCLIALSLRLSALADDYFGDKD